MQTIYGKHAVPRFIGVALAIAVGVGIGIGVSRAREGQPPKEEKAPEEPERANRLEVAAILTELHRFNRDAIELAKIAQSSASVDQVENFAITLEQRHRRADEDLLGLARQLRVDLKAPRDSEGVQERKHHLLGAEGRAFDWAFLQAVTTTGSIQIEALKGALVQLQNKRVKKYVTDLIPELEQNVKQAQRLKEVVAPR